MTQKPSVGRIVLFRSNQIKDVGFDGAEVPAIITAVHSDDCVNLTVFRDAQDPVPITSVNYAEDFEASGQGLAWRWPPRV